MGNYLCKIASLCLLIEAADSFEGSFLGLAMSLSWSRFVCVRFNLSQSNPDFAVWIPMRWSMKPLYWTKKTNYLPISTLLVFWRYTKLLSENVRRWKWASKLDHRNFWTYHQIPIKFIWTKILIADIKQGQIKKFGFSRYFKRCTRIFMRIYVNCIDQGLATNVWILCSRCFSSFFFFGCRVCTRSSYQSHGHKLHGQRLLKIASTLMLVQFRILRSQEIFFRPIHLTFIV